MTDAYVGIGANLGDPHLQLTLAAQQLQDAAGISVTGRSAIYRSAPVGPAGQDDYLNAVVAIETTLDTRALLATLQSIESLAGRQRGERWGPRQLDLDLLFFGKEALHEPDLTVPHPRIGERNFVLRPLADLLGDSWELPQGPTIAEQLQRCPDNRLERTSLDWTPTRAGLAKQVAS